MKKSVVSLFVCLLLGVQFGFAQNTSVGSFLAELAGGSYGDALVKMNITKDMGAVPVEGFELMEIYALNEDDAAAKSTQKTLTEKIVSLVEGDGYVTLMQVKDGGDTVRMYLKKSGERTQELAMFVLDEDGEVAIIRIKGDFSDEDIESLAEVIQ